MLLREPRDERRVGLGEVVVELAVFDGNDLRRELRGVAARGLGAGTDEQRDDFTAVRLRRSAREREVRREQTDRAEALRANA